MSTVIPDVVFIQRKATSGRNIIEHLIRWVLKKPKAAGYDEYRHRQDMGLSFKALFLIKERGLRLTFVVLNPYRLRVAITYNNQGGKER